MTFKPNSLIRHGLWAAAYGTVGAIIILVTAFGIYLNSGEDLQVWHLAQLDEEFSADSEIKTFAISSCAFSSI